MKIPRIALFIFFNTIVSVFFIYCLDDRVWYTDYDKREWYCKLTLIIFIVQLFSCGCLYKIIFQFDNIWKAKVSSEF